MHAWIDSFYIDGVVKGQIETAQLMDKIPVLYILLVILGILELMMVKSSGIRHIKMFSKINRLTQWFSYACSCYICVGRLYKKEYIVRNYKNGDSQRTTVNEYLTGYYIGNKIFFNWSWMIMLLIATILCIIIQSGIIKGLSGRAGMLAGIGIPALVTIMPSVIYAFNPPALFGYITLDISLCDMTDNAFYMYLVTFCVCMTGIHTDISCDKRASGYEKAGRDICYKCCYKCNSYDYCFGQIFTCNPVYAVDSCRLRISYTGVHMCGC